jgi:hypothetical protein
VAVADNDITMAAGTGFGWVTAEGFARGRLVFVLAAAVLRCYLLPQCVQQQLYLSVLLVSEATVMPATHVAVERLQLQVTAMIRCRGVVPG